MNPRPREGCLEYPRRVSHSHRRSWLGFPARRILRLAAIVIIVFGPIASAARAVHAPGGPGYVEIDPAAASGSAGDHVREYLAGRDPAIDRLLPDGARGTRFFEDLDGEAGMAFPHLSLIGISATAASGGWPGAVELHERAHLLQAFLPEDASRLLARLDAPAEREYAATGEREHFAEMAAKAWEVVSQPAGMCVDAAPLERLRDAESRVPGTAGFVAWYLRNLRKEDVEEFDPLVQTAALLAAPYRAESEAIWKSLEARRLPDGHFQAWSHQTVPFFFRAWPSFLSPAAS